eukprot:scaffold202_cov58-Phaeocystis_antarctica.AAC.2
MVALGLPSVCSAALRKLGEPMHVPRTHCRAPAEGVSAGGRAGGRWFGVEGVGRRTLPIVLVARQSIHIGGVVRVAHVAHPPLRLLCFPGRGRVQVWLGLGLGSGLGSGLGVGLDYKASVHIGSGAAAGCRGCTGRA